jgi:glutamate-1-semialdehyde 2,1-aminomutase
VFFKEGRGATLTSVEGKRYIDFCQSFGPLILGHADVDVHAEVTRALESGWVFGACEPFSLELAEWIVARVPHVEKLRFVVSGTEAVMSALRVARAATGRNKVLKFEGCYHGHVDSLLVKAGSGLAGVAAADSAGVSPHTASETLVARLDDEESVVRILRDHGHEIAALIIEPLPANYGLLIQREAFLKKIVADARAAGALVIFDEVISGFRTAIGGMAQILGIQPDLVTYGKIIGGGFPVGAYGGRRDLLDLVAPSGPVYQAGTLSASPIGMRAGLATLAKVESAGVHATLERRTGKFVEELGGVFKKASAPFAVKRFGSIFWIHPSDADPAVEIRSLQALPKDLNARFAPLFRELLAEGVYLPPSGYEVGFVGLAHDEKILGEVLAKTESAVRRLGEK